MKNTIRIPNATRVGYLECGEKGVFDASYPGSKTIRGRVQGVLGNILPGLMCGTQNLILIDTIMETTSEIKQRPEGKGWCWDENNGKWFRIRKLTPRECFRLMDVRDSDFEKLLATDSYDKNGNPRRAISDSQLYKMAGNSIVVSCLDLIFENLFFPQRREGELF